MTIYPTAKIVHPEGIRAEDDRFHIGDFCLVTVPVLEIGSCSQINAGTKILGREHVRIGRHSVISYDCLLLTSSDSPYEAPYHDDYSPEDMRAIDSEGITIGDFCFIGAKCILMPGTNLPDHTIVRAMSYVTRRGIHDTRRQA